MSRPTREVVRSQILERRASSGLGVGCVEAQADGVPCEEVARDCVNCEKAAKEVAAGGGPSVTK